jgi:hypothetical protein
VSRYTAVDLSAFARRDYQYNALLKTARNIPFSPFIADLVEWKPADAGDVFPPG